MLKISDYKNAALKGEINRKVKGVEKSIFRLTMFCFSMSVFKNRKTFVCCLYYFVVKLRMV